MFQCYSPKSSHPLPLPQSPKDCSIHLCLFCCLAYRIIVTIFLNSIYMHCCCCCCCCCQVASVMSDSVRPHRWQTTRLPRPWDSPGKNTGVGCHFHLQCVKVKSESEVAQLCLTLSDPMDCSPPGSSIHGIFQARVLEWGAIAFSAPCNEWTGKHFQCGRVLTMFRSMFKMPLVLGFIHSCHPKDVLS